MDDLTAFLIGVAAGAVIAGALIWLGLTWYLTRGDR